ncbi:hypothetical protein DER46DRAFT_656039 [Fusarium sp. MPI-SDFR-AT-0072]|nr:hypothetical protein DER46DRAFT_656039 [Fusarium sp. MPI-SDFR-AT-0072]
MKTLYQTKAKRLHTPGIINVEQDGQLAMNLEGQELKVFLTVLPWVVYDYRRAYFVARESETDDDLVLETKIQLSAKPEPADTLQAVIDACTGYSRPLCVKPSPGSAIVALELDLRVGPSFTTIRESDYVYMLFEGAESWWATNLHQGFAEKKAFSEKVDADSA